VISATVALQAGRACHQAVAVAVVAVALALAAVVAVVAVAVAVAVAGGSHENIPVINTSTLKGEENNASRNEQ